MSERNYVPTHIPRVAIVDDDEDLRMSLASLIASEGFATEIFESGQALLDRGGIEDFACIVTDLQMPGINGLLLAREIRRDHAVPIILITAFPAKGLGQQATAAGIAAVLRKPFDPDELVAHLTALTR